MAMMTETDLELGGALEGIVEMFRCPFGSYFFLVARRRDRTQRFPRTTKLSLRVHEENELCHDHHLSACVAWLYIGPAALRGACYLLRSMLCG